MKRAIFLILLVLILCLGGYFLNQYWIHRFDAIIERQASIYRVDPDLVWSIVYEETYFSPWKIGKDNEVGLMQVTPAVGREWASETGMRELERQMAENPRAVLRDPERNIQIGCWYLEKLYAQFRDLPNADARMVAAYNAGPSRATDWGRSAGGVALATSDDFISRIDIPSTRAYVISVLDRYHRRKQSRM